MKSSILFSDEQHCEEYLKELREKEGISCKHCGSWKHRWDKFNKYWICTSCGHHTTLTSETLMHGSRLPLLCWFQAVELTLYNRAISISDLQKTLGNKRYQSVFSLEKKILNAIKQVETINHKDTITIKHVLLDNYREYVNHNKPSNPAVIRHADSDRILEECLKLYLMERTKPDIKHKSDIVHILPEYLIKLKQPKDIIDCPESLYSDRKWEYTVKEICEEHNISVSTFKSYLRKERAKGRQIPYRKSKSQNKGNV